MPIKGYQTSHDDVIKWKHFPRYWPFVRGIHRSPVNSLHKGQWRGALMFSLICACINGWVNKCEAGDWGRHQAHYDVTVMVSANSIWVYLAHIHQRSILRLEHGYGTHPVLLLDNVYMQTSRAIHLTVWNIMVYWPTVYGITRYT